MDELHNYAADLIDHVSTDEEMTHLVDRATKHINQTAHDKPPKLLARIRLAIRYGQKKVTTQF